MQRKIRAQEVVEERTGLLIKRNKWLPVTEHNDGAMSIDAKDATPWWNLSQKLYLSAIGATALKFAVSDGEVDPGSLIPATRNEDGKLLPVEPAQKPLDAKIFYWSTYPAMSTGIAYPWVDMAIPQIRKLDNGTSQIRYR